MFNSTINLYGCVLEIVQLFTMK
uniref:Uncharacterized protein n=1 Tax=Rhizophora mucronata TaxID=61149 RepID=A0A2P2QZZ9_RHIMU